MAMKSFPSVFSAILLGQFLGSVPIGEFGMPSQFATPLLLTEDATTQLERLPLSSQAGGNGYDEEWLQETLSKKPTYPAINFRKIDSN
jgi:hypothetical protein